MKHIATLIIGLCIGIAVYFVFDEYRHENTENSVQNIVKDTIYDTVSYRKPVIYDSVVVRHISKALPIDNLTKDCVIVKRGDSLSVKIPITQKQYKDSTFTAWVSGYEANLDSINIYPKTYTQTILKQTYIQKKPKRWGVGVQVGTGVVNNKVYPYIGVGVSYNIFAW